MGKDNERNEKKWRLRRELESVNFDLKKKLRARSKETSKIRKLQDRLAELERLPEVGEYAEVQAQLRILISESNNEAIGIGRLCIQADSLSTELDALKR